MKRKLFTHVHKRENLEKHRLFKRFSSDERSKLTELENKSPVNSKSDILSNWLSREFKKLESLSFLINLIKNNNYKNIISLGSGTCALEYLLKLSLPKYCSVIASDFDKVPIYNAKKYFPEIKCLHFDFFKNSFNEVFNLDEEQVDLVFFMGSAYVMDDEEYVNLFRSIKSSNPKVIIDFVGGYIDLGDFIKFKKMDFMHKYSSFGKIRNSLTNSSFLRKVFQKLPINNRLRDRAYSGKFHGYRRSLINQRILYRLADLRIEQETNDLEYKYIAILKP